MIFIAGISIALFISALLLSKSNKSSADYILVVWMLLNAFHLTLFYFIINGTIYSYPFLIGLVFPLPLLHGVLLYFYVSLVTNQFPKNKWVAALHFIPSMITLLYLIPFFLLPAAQKIEIFQNQGKDYQRFQQILLMAVFLSGIIYVIWSSVILNNHKKRIRHQFSSVEKINLNWLRFLTYGLGLIWTLVIFVQNDFVIFIGVSVFVILIGFFGIQQTNIFAGQPLPDKKLAQSPDITEIEQKEKYATAKLSDEKLETYYALLKKLMREEKVYTDAELSLSQLAAKMEIHPNYLSQIINSKEQKTFYDLINTYRVEEFIRLSRLPNNQQFTLLSLAYEAGFNSKSSFNRYFKKITGQTPSQYVKTQKV